LVRIYLDLETYRPQKELAFMKEKILVIGTLVDETPYHESSLDEKIEPQLYAKWSLDDEKTVIRNFYANLQETIDAHRFTVIAGFNSLRFDIPILTLKGLEYKVDSPKRLTKLWHDTFAIDYFQQLLIANNNLFRGLTLENIVNVAKKIGLNPPSIYKTGSSVKELYESGEYREIERHLMADLCIVRWLDLIGARQLIARSLKEKRPLFKD